MVHLCKRDCPRRRPGCQDGCPVLAEQNRVNHAILDDLRAECERLSDSSFRAKNGEPLDKTKSLTAQWHRRLSGRPKY